MTQWAMDPGLLDALYRRDATAIDPEPVARRRVGCGAGIRIAGLHKSFGDRAVLRDISLEIAAGEFIAIVGRSGSGKSTLLRLLAGLDTPSAGDVTISGKPVFGRAAEARPMFQDARLLPWRRMLDYVGIGLRGAWDGKARAALSAVGLEDREEDWPATLSDGQRRRVALARALVSRPKLLLLDDPLGALDALTRYEMQQLIEAMWLAQGFTAILVTHDVAEAVAMADRVIVIEDGAIGLEIAVGAERPRPRGSAKLAALEAALLDRLPSQSAPRPGVSAAPRPRATVGA